MSVPTSSACFPAPTPACARRTPPVAASSAARPQPAPEDDLGAEACEGSDTLSCGDILGGCFSYCGGPQGCRKVALRAETRPRFDRSWPIQAKLWLAPAKVCKQLGRTSTKIGRRWPSSTTASRSLVKCWSTLSKAWPRCGSHRPSLVEICQGLAKFGEHWPTLGSNRPEQLFEDVRGRHTSKNTCAPSSLRSGNAVSRQSQACCARSPS